MADSNTDISEQVADMIIEQDVVAPPKTPAYLKIPSLRFTREEAKLALKLRTTGGRLDELAERTGIKPERLKLTWILYVSQSGEVADALSELAGVDLDQSAIRRRRQTFRPRLTP